MQEREYDPFEYWLGVISICLLIGLPIFSPSVALYIATFLGVVLVGVMMVVVSVCVLTFEKLKPLLTVIDGEHIIFLSIVLFTALVVWRIRGNLSKVSNRKGLIEIPLSARMLRITEILFSPKTQREVFCQIALDWDSEYCGLLISGAKNRAFWMNVRYMWAFLASAAQKSPLGDLFELIIKIAKP